MSTTQSALQYECFGKIAEGSVSTVYEGFDHDLKRDVVIKELRAEFRSNSEIVESFFAEATLLAGLNHANILRVHSIDRERFWIVMEPMAGTLAAELKQGKLTFERQREILKQVLEGIRYLHLNGRVHGQVRLDSILVDSFGQTKLSNLFIADMQDEFRRPDQKQLHTAPEILNPRHFGQPGQRSDLYSLGIVALQLAAGDKFLKLFKGMERKRQQDPMAWSAWHASAEPVGNIREIVEDIPSDILAAIEGLTQKHVELRFATASEAISVLTSSVAHSQTSDPALAVGEDRSFAQISPCDPIVYQGPDIYRPAISLAEENQPGWKSILAAHANWKTRLPSKRQFAIVGTGLSMLAVLGVIAFSDRRGQEENAKTESVAVKLPKTSEPKPSTEPSKAVKPVQEPLGNHKLSIVSSDERAEPLRDARITIDGEVDKQLKEKSRSTYILSKKPGVYLVRVEAANHEPRNELVELTEGVEGHSTIRLDRKLFDLSVSIAPADARVTIQAANGLNETALGEQGQEIRSTSIPSGSYLVSAQADGFKRVMQRIVVSDHQSLSHTITLVPIPKVKIWIDSYPQGARVAVDGKEVGLTPCYWEGEEGSRSTISLKLQGYVPIQWQTVLHARETPYEWILDKVPELFARQD